MVRAFKITQIPFGWEFYPQITDKTHYHYYPHKNSFCVIGLANKPYESGLSKATLVSSVVLKDSDHYQSGSAER